LPPSVNNSTLTLEEFESYFVGQIKPPQVEYFDDSFMADIHNFIDNYMSLNQEEESIYNEICNNVITKEEISVHLGKLKNNKAAGYDGIISEFIKFAPEIMTEMLFVAFNFIFDKGEWPSEWATGLISPIHKKESINVPDNYRKVTVMPVIGKVLESILNNRLVYHNITLSIDDPLQFGFKAGCQTSDNIFILYSMIMRQRFKRKPLYVCFVDFTKAFDYVDRSALYYKLIKRGVNGKMLRIIIDLYRKAKCRVKWKNRIGDEIESEFGVLQGGYAKSKVVYRIFDRS
jgi:hypothetical protein